MALRLRTVVGLTVPNLGGRRQQSLPDSTLCSEVGVVMAGGTQSPDAIAVCLLERGRTRSRRIVGFRRVRRLWSPPTNVPPLPVRQALRAARPTKRKHHD